jgi:hypothetical protein
MDCEYWKNIVARLRVESNWASHVLATFADEKDSNLREALKCVSAEEIIENTIYAYEDWSAQPYCDEILFQFKKSEIIKIFENIKSPSENMKKGVSRFFEL